MQSATIFGMADRCTFKTDIGEHSLAATKSWKPLFDEF